MHRSTHAITTPPTLAWDTPQPSDSAPLLVPVDDHSARRGLPRRCCRGCSSDKATVSA